MEFVVMQACEGGRKVQKHLRVASRTRGTLRIKQEEDAERHRAILVARLSPAAGARRIRPLYDVQLIGCTGDTWTLTGHERIEAGPLQQQTAVAQTWLLELAAVDDLAAAEQKWINAVREANELREKLAAMAAAPDVATNASGGA